MKNSFPIIIIFIIKRFFILCIQNLHMVILAEEILIKVFVQRGIK